MSDTVRAKILKIRFALVAVLLGMTATANAQNSLPNAGTCRSDGAEDHLPERLRTSVIWRGNEATVTSLSDRLSGESVGIRPFNDEGFKLSVFYEEPTLGFAEMVIIGEPRMKGAREFRYRMAIVYYEIARGGRRVVSAVQPFEDATCITAN